MVRTSVFGWQTFPNLWLACDHFVGKVPVVQHLVDSFCKSVLMYINLPAANISKSEFLESNMPGKLLCTEFMVSLQMVL